MPFIIFLLHLNIFRYNFVDLIKIIRSYVHLFIEFLHLFLTSISAIIFIVYSLVLQGANKRKIVKGSFWTSFKIVQTIFCLKRLGQFNWQLALIPMPESPNRIWHRFWYFSHPAFLSCYFWLWLSDLNLTLKSEVIQKVIQMRNLYFSTKLKYLVWFQIEIGEVFS